MHLRNTRTRPSPLLQHTPSRNPKHLLRRLPKVLPDHGLDIPPLILRRIVEHPREHALELGRQDRRLHGDRLSDFQIQAAIATQEVGETLCIARVHGGDGGGEGRVGAEVELVVEGDEEAEGEGAGGAGDGRGVEGRVEGVDSAGGQGEVEEASQPFAGSGVGLCGDGLA